MLSFTVVAVIIFSERVHFIWFIWIISFVFIRYSSSGRLHAFPRLSFFRVGRRCFPHPGTFLPGLLPGIQSFLIAGTVSADHVPELLPVDRPEIVMLPL